MSSEWGAPCKYVGGLEWYQGDQASLNCVTQVQAPCCPAHTHMSVLMQGSATPAVEDMYALQAD